MPPTSTATCPNCHATITPGSRQCVICKLEVAKMSAFAAAKKAAQQRGFKTTAVETAETPAWRDPANLGRAVKIVCLLAFVGGIGWLGYHFFGPKPARYLQFPATAQAAATEFMTHIAGGDATYDKAYFLVADTVRDTKASDERGDYVQVFHLLNRYLAAEFGADWITWTQCVPDPANPDVIVATVALETLHIRTAQQTPADKMQSQGAHYGILGIDEFDVQYAADMRQNALIRDILNGVAGSGAESNWDAVFGANAANRHLPKFMTKMIVLQSLRNPRSANWKAVIQTDPLRTDPVIQARLKAILTDERYDKDVRNAAKEVLDDKVTDEERIAVGI